MWPIGGLLLLLQAAAPGASAPPAPDWPPVSFTAPRIEQQHPELGRVRDRLLAAIRDRRVDRVRALMAPTIRDQDDDVPVDEILASFGPLARDTPLGDEWRALEQALRLGGVLRDGAYVLPFIERDAAALAVAHRAALRGRPRRRGARRTRCRRATWCARVSNALVQEAVGVPTRAGAAGSACPDWTPVVGPGAPPGLDLHHRHASGQRPLLRVHPRRRRVEADADLLAARITAPARAPNAVVHARDACRLHPLDLDSPSAGHLGVRIPRRRVDRTRCRPATFKGARS